MADQTPTQRLATALLGEDLEGFVAARRPHTSWRLIARDLLEATDGQVDVTDQTLQNWYGDGERATAKAGVA